MELERDSTDDQLFCLPINSQEGADFTGGVQMGSEAKIGHLDDADADICEWCRWPIVEGEARLQVFSVAFHLRCWDSSVEALRAPRRREKPC
jgi:hypothetical protein